jgi:hypothetical protein
LGLGFAACDRGDGNQRGDAPGTTAPDRSPTAKAPEGADTSATAMSDSDLEQAIKAKLDADEQLRTANLDIDANADKKK